MTMRYRLTLWRRLLNGLVKALVRSGLGPTNTYLLSVRGRRTGKLYTTPVTLVEQANDRWLVSPYGEVSWVQNARAAGQVMLTRGAQSEEVRITELSPEASGPILKAYVSRIGIVRPYFDAGPDSPVEAFVPEAPRHPVFRIESKS